MAASYLPSLSLPNLALACCFYIPLPQQAVLRFVGRHGWPEQSLGENRSEDMRLPDGTEKSVHTEKGLLIRSIPGLETPA